MKYRVISASSDGIARALPDDKRQRVSVEINGVLYFEGADVDESAFRTKDPHSGEPWSELASLLATKHIAPVADGN